MNVLGTLGFALIAAIGNAVYALGQRKGADVENGFIFIALTALVAMTLLFLVTPFIGQTNYVATFKNSYQWILVSGCGVAITFVGFNLLYTKYGASHYLLYAVLSIITTSILVGVMYFREPFNGYHWGSLALSVATVVLFSMGEAKA